MRFALYVIGLSSALWLSVSIPAAAAGKPVNVAKVSGLAYAVQANDSHWLSCWAEQPNGQFKLMVIDADKGSSREVYSTDRPGGMCWIPKVGQLFFSRGVYQEAVKSTRVFYQLYDANKEAAKKKVEITKIKETTDFLDTYQIDPLTAEDGSRVFHWTLGVGSLPSFNIYSPKTGSLDILQADAKIGSQYDLSSDGTTVYWMMHDPTTSEMYIVGWNLDKGKYTELYPFKKNTDPADDHAWLKVDSPKHRAAAIVTSAKDPTLQLCIYYLDKLAVSPIHLKEGEQIEYFDWKGRSGTIYALISSGGGKKYSLEEIEPLTGARTLLVQTSEAIQVTYAPTQSYYYTTTDNRNPKNPLTYVWRLK